MYHVRVTFLLRSRFVSVTYLYSYGISLSYVRRISAYVLRTCDVCMAYERRMYCVPFLSAAYLFCTNCFLIPMRTNGCVHFAHAIRTL